MARRCSSLPVSATAHDHGDADEDVDGVQVDADGPEANNSAINRYSETLAVFQQKSENKIPRLFHDNSHDFPGRQT